MSGRPSGSGKVPTAARRRRLLEAAEAIRAFAYAPYSGFAVGAAVMDARGRIFSGCNVENHSSPSSLCAEQAAVARAVAGGSQDLVALALVAEGDPRVLPCGRCRQVLIEFGPAMLVLAARPGEEPEELLLADLLPRPFRR